MATPSHSNGRGDQDRLTGCVPGITAVFLRRALLFPPPVGRSACRRISLANGGGRCRCSGTAPSSRLPMKGCSGFSRMLENPHPYQRSHRHQRSHRPDRLLIPSVGLLTGSVYRRTGPPLLAAGRYRRGQETPGWVGDGREKVG